MKPLHNTVVHLPTQEDYDEYMKMCEEAGWKWGSGENPKEVRNAFNFYKEMTYVLVSDVMGFASNEWFKSRDFKIITLKQLKSMNETTKTLENLEVGDLVINGNDGWFRRVLGVITPNNGELTLYVMSKGNDDKYSDSLKKACNPWTVFELKECGYTPYTETSDEIERAMEVLERNGRIVDGKIIK